MGRGAGPSHIITEAPAAYSQAIHAARASDFSPELSRWLEASGVLLKVACLSHAVSSLVHSFRVAREGAAVLRSQIGFEGYRRVRKMLVDEVGTGHLSPKLQRAFEAEVRRSDAFVEQLAAGEKVASASGVKVAAKDEAGEALLRAWADRVADLPSPDSARVAFRKFISTVSSSDVGWGPIAEIARDRARRVKERFPGLARKDLASNPEARRLVEESYSWHGKGEMFEHYGRNYHATRGAADRALVDAQGRAAARGPDWTADTTVGELRLSVGPDPSGKWRKFSDQGVVVVPRGAPPPVHGEGVAVSGSAQPHTLFQYKAEAGRSDIPAQQAKDLRRLLDDWESGKPVYMSANFYDDQGRIVERVYLLEPPDPKAGLAFFGVGTSNARIAERAELAARGADVKNIATDISNDEMKRLWNELFWAAFDSI